MYKSIKIKKNITVSVEKFKKSAKYISKVYKSGFHKWEDKLNGLVFYSVVLGVYRLILVEEKQGLGVNNK